MKLNLTRNKEGPEIQILLNTSTFKKSFEKWVLSGSHRQPQAPPQRAPFIHCGENLNSNLPYWRNTAEHVRIRPETISRSARCFSPSWRAPGIPPIAPTSAPPHAILPVFTVYQERNTDGRSLMMSLSDIPFRKKLRCDSREPEVHISLKIGAVDTTSPNLTWKWGTCPPPDLWLTIHPNTIRSWLRLRTWTRATPHELLPWWPHQKAWYVNAKYIIC